MEQEGDLSATQAKAVLGALLESGGDPRAIAASKGFERLSSDVLSATVDQLVAAYPEEWARFVEGDDKLAQFFVGHVMKATRGQADGKAVIAALHARR